MRHEVLVSDCWNQLPEASSLIGTRCLAAEMQVSRKDVGNHTRIEKAKRHHSNYNRCDRRLNCQGPESIGQHRFRLTDVMSRVPIWLRGGRLTSRFHEPRSLKASRWHCAVSCRLRRPDERGSFMIWATCLLIPTILNRALPIRIPGPPST